MKCASGVVGVRRARSDDNVESARAGRRREKKRGPETRAKRKEGERISHRVERYVKH